MKTYFNSLRVQTAVLALAGAVVLAGATIGIAQSSKDKSDKPVSADLNVPLDQTSVPRDGLPRGSYAPIVDKVAPAVVKIDTTATIKTASAELAPQFNNPFFQQFFGNQFGRMIPPQSSAPEIEHGVGSGVIITKDGYILTNNHVVDDAKNVKVTLPDGRVFTAKVIGRDPKTDVAVVKIDAKNLPVVVLADSSNVKVGDVVLAIGNPFGVGQTVTAGIVSAKDRGNMGIEDYEDFIQTDAAINPGNSGGALVDIDGRLIGINTAILSHTGGSQGVGFAVPSDLARNVMESLVQNGRVTRGYLGVMIQSITPELEQQFNLKNMTGALVGDVVPNGPADHAGLKDGDVVLEFNGQKVADSRELQLTVADTKPGSKVPVEILRNGDKKTLEVTVKQLPGTEQLASDNSPNAQDTGTLNGVGVGDLDPQTRQQFHIPQNVHGAVITQVDPTSASADAGLKPGEVIESINRHPVKDADDAVRLTDNITNKKTLVRVWDGGGSHYIVVDESQGEG
ncbi:MAG TPA: DegQ family serine endoprotease [Verrucomicrobiae bacterium]